MRRLGFTLIELLVVIAIIAILAAIIFPVFMRAKANAYKSSDLSNMNALRNALQLYRADNEAYPPALLGYVTLYSSGPNVGNIIPANELQGPLYPRRVDSLEVFRPSYNRTKTSEITTAVWPNQDSRAAGSAPILDLNGDGGLTNADDPQEARQAYGPATTVQRVNPADPTGPLINAEYYKVSGYDVSEIPVTSNTVRYELRYALFWTNWGLGVNGASLGNRMDDPRQLGYNDPPENTVVTWNTYFRDYPGGNGGVPGNNKMDVILFLGGNAKAYSSRSLYDRSWRVLP